MEITCDPLTFNAALAIFHLLFPRWSQIAANSRAPPLIAYIGYIGYTRRGLEIAIEASAHRHLSSQHVHIKLVAL